MGGKRLMTTFEKIIAVLNLIAVLLIPVVAVIVGQYLQEKAQKRNDKMQIFQCLMTRRITGWAALEAVNAINSIDIVFTDNKEIRNQLSVWKSKCRRDIPSEDRYREQCKLLEMMANDLGYKNKITWDIIQNPYYPEGLDQQLSMNNQIMNGQVEWAKAAGLLSQMMGKPQHNSENTDFVDT